MSGRPAFEETIAIGDRRPPLAMRLWRPTWRVVVACWAGAVGGGIAAFALGAPTALAWVLALAVAAAGVAYPLSASRRSPIDVSVGAEALVIEQGPRRMSVPLSTIRAASVLVPAGAARHTHGWGLSWGHAGRRVWDLPVDGLGMVRVERTHRGLDVDVATADPERLVEAVVDALARGRRDRAEASKLSR